MKRRSFNWDNLTITGGVQVESSSQGRIVTWPEDGNGQIILKGNPNRIGGIDWNGATHFVAEITGLNDFDATLGYYFMEENEEFPGVFVNAGAIPSIRVQVSFELSLLDSHEMFPPRTPGRLKEIVIGKGISLNEATMLIIAVKKSHVKQRMIIHDLYLSEGEPDYSLDMKPMVDSMGQWKEKQWPGKMRSESEMILAMRKDLTEPFTESLGEGFSRFGGSMHKRFAATGFFHTAQDGGHWYLVDPDGYAFISTGVDVCSPYSAGLLTDIMPLFENLPDEKEFDAAYNGGEHNRPGKYLSHLTANLMKAYGADWEEKWQRLTVSRLNKWKFNTIGNWSNPAFIRAAAKPYVWPLEGFPGTEVNIFRDFPDVFSKEYEKNSEIFARQLKPFSGDPFMIGYFLRNEPAWAFVHGLLIADKVMENPAPTACRNTFIQRLQEKYTEIETLNLAWEKDYASWEDLRKPIKGLEKGNENLRSDLIEFSKAMIRRYVEIPSKACKKADPGHMNLGMRYSQLTDLILLEGHENFDVFSLNGYQSSPYEEVQKAGEITGKPIMIGEFHFGAPDAGMLAAGICSVKTQKDRGLAYRQYYEEGLKSPYFVGAHYFILNDQAVLGRFDGENMNVGLLDVCNRPYLECVDEMIKVNADVYRMAEGTAVPGEYTVQRIPRMMGF